MEKSMKRYLVLVKLDPQKTEPIINRLSKLPENPSEGIRIRESYNVFGTWEVALWFEADSNDNALNFVDKNIRSLDGVTETYTLPTAPIKDYIRK